MKTLKKDIKKGIIKVYAEDSDDVWYLSNIIDTEDSIRGRTTRKIKIGDEQNAKVVRKKVNIALSVEKVEFEGESLRVTGKITQAPEDIPKGNYHSFNIEPGTDIEIEKKRWPRFQLDIIEEACSKKRPNIIICVLDREDVMFSVLKKSGHSVISSYQGDVDKKEERNRAKGDFYSNVIESLKEYVSRYKAESVIVASPAFWKDELLSRIKDEELKSKITVSSCSSAGHNAINEIIRRPEVKEVLKQDRIAKESKVVEELLAEIKKGGKAEYGFLKVKKAVMLGAVRMFLITDDLIKKLRDEEKFGDAEEMMKNVESMQGEVHIISSDHDPGKVLDGLSGVGALLRYKIE